MALMEAGPPGSAVGVQNHGSVHRGPESGGAAYAGVPASSSATLNGSGRGTSARFPKGPGHLPVEVGGPENVLMPTAHLPETDLYYERVGTEGDPAVLIHGSLADHTAWDRLVPLLSQNLAIVVYDRRGFGRSTAGPKPHPVSTDVGDLAALLESLDLFPVHLVAHSYGGPVALRLAALRPELVRSVSVHEAPMVGLLADQPATAAEGRGYLDGIEENCELVRTGGGARAAQRVVDLFSPPGGAWERLPEPARLEITGRMDRWVEEYTDPESLRPSPTELADLLVPVLLSLGGKSPPFLGRIRSLLAVQLSNVHELDLPDAGHAPHRTHPAEYAGILLSFLLDRNVPSH
jgi:pimeloyl-ACP methyl ester carboxylesterase